MIIIIRDFKYDLNILRQYAEVWVEHPSPLPNILVKTAVYRGMKFWVINNLFVTRYCIENLGLSVAQGKITSV